MTVFLTHAPADAGPAAALAATFAARAGRAELEDGSRGFRPMMGRDVVVLIWSQAALMGIYRLQMERRALEAWAEGRLILVQLDRSFLPVGLRDLPAVDAAFEPQRPFVWAKVVEAARAAEREADGFGQDVDSAPEGPRRLPFPAKRGAPGWFERIFGRRDRASASPAPEPEAQAAPIFISYASKDATIVRPLAKALAARRPIWIDKQGIAAGEGWAGEIVRGIKAAAGVVVMCSASSFESDHVKREVYLADRYKKPLRPVFLEAVAPPEDFEFFFAGVQWLALHDLPDAAHADALIALAENVGARA